MTSRYDFGRLKFRNFSKRELRRNKLCTHNAIVIIMRLSSFYPLSVDSFYQTHMQESRTDVDIFMGAKSYFP